MRSELYFLLFGSVIFTFVRFSESKPYPLFRILSVRPELYYLLYIAFGEIFNW